MKTTLDLALSRLELLMAERDAVEQAPAMVTGTGGAQPVPAQAPASRPATPPVEGVREPPRDGLVPFLPAAAVPRQGQRMKDCIPSYRNERQDQQLSRC